jgi:hypothetical protein
MKKSIVFFLFLISTSLFSQSASLGGRILDANNNAISFVSVLLFDIDATSPFKGTTTDENGNFSLHNLKEAQYRVTFSFVGFKTKEATINVVSIKNLGIIILEESLEELDVAIVTAKKPTISKKVDRLIFNVENTTLSSGNSWEILKRTPGVISIQESLMIRGEGANVYLNGRKVQISASELKTFLEGFSGANVKAIEVITNPPAQYDAESGPILNITTSKAVSIGYKGRLDGAYTQAVFPKYNFGTSHFYKTKSLNLFFNYSFSPKKEFKEDDGKVNFINENNEVFTTWENDFNRTTRSKAHSANLVLDYDLDERNTINLTSNLLYSPNRTFNNNIINESFNAQHQLDSTFISKSNLRNDLSNIGADLTYKHSFKKEGASLSANFHYTDYERDRIQNVSTNYFDSENEFLRKVAFFTDAAQDIAIYTAQLDYETPLGSANFNIGVKTSVIDSESGIKFYEDLSGTLTLNGFRTDNYLYDEKVYAGYFSLSKDWEKLSTKIGLRAEQIEAEGTSLTLSIVNKQDYFELFPSAFIQYKLHEDHSIAFDYSRRVNRPRYEDLNPFSYFLNENTFQTGNPTLQPSFSHRFNFNYSLKNSYFFDVYYRDRGSFITTLSFQDNENLTVRTSEQNAIQATSYGLDFVHSRSITDFWYFYTYISVFHEEETFLAVESNNQEVTNDYNGVFAQAYNSFYLSKDKTLTGELSVAYWTGFIFGSFEQDTHTNLTIGLRKTLWNKRAVLTLASEDLLGKENARLTSRYLNQDYSFKAVPETQFIRFGFVYNFGNFRLQDNKRQIDKTERDRLNSQ